MDFVGVKNIENIDIDEISVVVDNVVCRYVICGSAYSVKLMDKNGKIVDAIVSHIKRDEKFDKREIIKLFLPKCKKGDKTLYECIRVKDFEVYKKEGFNIHKDWENEQFKFLIKAINEYDC